MWLCRVVGSGFPKAVESGSRTLRIIVVVVVAVVVVVVDVVVQTKRPRPLGVLGM